MIKVNNGVIVNDIYVPRPSTMAQAVRTQDVKGVVITENGDYIIVPDEGYGRMKKVDLHVNVAGPDCQESYDEGYNQGYTEGQENCPGCKLTTLEVTENGTYTPPTTPVLVFDGDDVFDFAYADTINVIEIMFKVNGSGWVFGNEKAGLFAESTDYITVYWFGYSGHYTINNGEVNTIVIKPYDSDTPIILNGGGYGISEREIDNTDTTEILLGGGNFDFCYGKFWSEYTSYLNGETPLFYYLPNSDGNIKRSLLGGDFEVFNNRGSGVCQYTEINEFDGFSRVDVNIKIDPTGLKFEGSLFAKVPDWLGPVTSEIQDISDMFRGCSNLSDISALSNWDTSNVTTMENLFSTCTSLTDATSIAGWDTSKVTTMLFMFQTNSNLTTIPYLNCINIPYSTGILNYYPIGGSTEFSNLTNVGGFYMKNSWNANYGLNKCPNLSYESCINIMNALYDFTGNGETPTSEQGTLKVHQNFLDLVGDEISIASGKGWTIIA